MGGPDPVALFYIYVVWSLAVPAIIATSSLIRVFETSGLGRFFAAASLLSMVVLLFMILLLDRPVFMLLAALVGAAFWFASLAFGTLKRAMIETGLVFIAISFPAALRFFF